MFAHASETGSFMSAVQAQTMKVKKSINELFTTKTFSVDFKGPSAGILIFGNPNYN
jgi:hypothetical protein